MIITQRWLGTATAMLLVATMISTVPSGAHAAPANDVTIAVQHRLLEEAAVAAGQGARAAGLADTRVTVTRRDGRAWAFGTAVLVAPQEEGLYPSGWIFVARHQRGDWQVAFEGEATFAELTAAAPASVVAPTGNGRSHQPPAPWPPTETSAPACACRSPSASPGPCGVARTAGRAPRDRSARSISKAVTSGCWPCAPAPRTRCARAGSG